MSDIIYEGCSPIYMGNPKYRPEYIEDINSIPCAKRIIYDRKNGNKTAYLHYIDGMCIYELCPKLWKGWQLMHKFVGEAEVY